jgi:thiamine transporter ThiT
MNKVEGRATMDITRVAAIIYAILIVGVVVFQVALAAGAPWGAYAMGGASPGQFSPAMRVGAIVQAVLLAGMAVVILARAELTLPGWWRVSHWLVWIVVAITALSLVLNLISPSAGERAIWLPTLSLLFISSLIVAFSK